MATAGYGASGPAYPQDPSRARAHATNVTLFPGNESNQALIYNHDYHDPGACAGAPTRARACARVEAAGENLLSALFEDVFCRHMPQIVAAEISDLMAKGASLDLICAVIRYTAGAPRPSWAYARAVLRRQMDMGTRTAADFQAREAARASAPPPKRVIEQCYGQRPYDPADFGELSDEQLAELARR